MAPTYNVHSLTRQLAMSFNDGKWSYASYVGTFTGFSLLTEQEYAQFILRNVISDELTLTLNKRTTGNYVYQLGEIEPTSIWLNNHTTPFTGEASAVYEVYCRGASIWATVTTGITATSISLTGVQVDFRRALADCKGFIADNRLLQFAQSFANGSMTPEQALAFLRQDEKNTRGSFYA